jgi:IS1 family transposase
MQKVLWNGESLLLLVMIVWMWENYLGVLQTRGKAAQKKTKRAWHLKPRTPDDCQDCRVERWEVMPDVQRTARPWSEVKSPRGRPKTHDTDGQACMEPCGEYYKDTDGTYHALRWDGTRSKCEATPSVEYGACGSKHTARLGTPLYQLKTASERVTLAVHLAMKGMSIADISEVMGHSEETVSRWLERNGLHSEKLHERAFKHLAVQHIQLDELVNKVRRLGRRVWVWTAEDALSKAWLAWHVGKRTQADAHRIIHRVKRVLAEDCVPVFTSDGLAQYFYGLTAHFGAWGKEEGHRKPVWHVRSTLLYGQFRKLKVGHKLKQVYTKMLCGQRSDLETTLQGLGLSGKIQTAFIERLNLTLRHLVAALSRRGWALAYTVQGLRWRIALAAGYYNFCRPHHALRVPVGEGRFRGRTPAMALGVTGHRWSVREFITHPVY